jgi:tRNA threonylcarbamoyladenosine biosynthesis protein TsaB
MSICESVRGMHVGIYPSYKSVSCDRIASVLILAIDTSTRFGSVAILRDLEVLAETSGSEETPYLQRVFRDLKFLQDKAEFELKEIDLFAVTSGPGSFTGLRVGLAAVKAWAEIYQKPIAAISGLEAIATQARPSPGMVASFLDARRDQVFGATYRRGIPESMPLELIGEEAVLSAEEFLAMVKGNCGSEPVTLVSPTPGVLTPATLAAHLPGARIHEVSANLARHVGMLGFERATRGALTDALHLDANYLRRSDAEQFRKGA